MMESQNNIPHLRFPEYDGKWNSRKLEKYILDHKGGAPLKPSDFVRFSKCEVIPKKAITGGGKLLLDLEQATFCSEEFFRNYKNSIVDNSFLITTLRDLVPSGPNIGFIVKNESKSKYMLAQGVYGIKINTEELIEDFLIQLSNTSKYRKLMQTLKVGSTQVHIRNSIFFGIDVVSPSLPEQQKIADFLSAVDDKLQALKKKKELLEQYKKGVMQKIFSQEIRFRDENGENFSDWEEKKLGDIGEIITGKTPNTNDPSLWNGNIQFVTPTDINDEKYQYHTARTITKSKKIIPTNSIMFTCIASIGKMSLSVYPCITNQQINSIIPDNDFNNEFIYYSLLNIVDYIKSTQSNNTLPIINKTEFSKFKIRIPFSRKEQDIIAEFLATIDNKINYCQNQIDQAEQWKKGLLQKMFV
jgi:type I restriction enzyme S subunit